MLLATKMSLLQTIEQDLITAFKGRDDFRVTVLRNAKSAIKNAEIAKRPVALSEEEVVEVLGREVKKLRDALADFSRGGREDLVEKTNKEIAILSEYLPRGLSEEELRAIVKKVIETVKPVGPQDFGKVMGAAMKEAKGKASGDAVGKIVKEMLVS